MIEERNVNSYGDLYDDRQEDLKLVRIMKNVKGCPVLKYGAKKIKMSYYFCNCDPNQKDPICEECAHKCHFGHSLTPRYDYETNPVKQVCMCGLRCHQLNGSNNASGETTYQPICFFHELSVHSKQYIYYENMESGNVICPYCAFFCLNDEKNWKDSKVYEMKKAEEVDEMPQCMCPCQTHRDLKQILTYNYKYTDPDNTIIPGYTPTHMLNLLLKSENSFKNLYSSFLSELEAYEGEMDKPDFVFDKKMNISIFYWAVGNFASMSLNLEEFYYFDPKIRQVFTVSLISKILEKKINDHTVIFNFVQSTLRSFQKYIISPLFEFLPKLKVMDYANMSPFHRIFFVQNVKSNHNFFNALNDEGFAAPEMKKDEERGSNSDLKIIDKYIQCFESMIRQRFENKEGFIILLSITSILKKFSKYYLLSYDQVIKFASLIDDLFYYFSSFNKKLAKRFSSRDYNMKQLEIKIVTRIAKIFIFFSFYYNDTLFSSYLNKDDFKPVFIHTYNELGKLLTKNMIHLVNYLKEELEKVKVGNKNKTAPGFKSTLKTSLSFSREKSNNTQNFYAKEMEEVDDENEEAYGEKLTKEEQSEMELRDRLKKVLMLSQNLISIFLHSEDSYFLGLKRALNVNVDSMVKIMNDSFTPKDSTFISFIEIQSKSIELQYNSYFNFNCTFEGLSTYIQSIIVSLFNVTDSTDYKGPELNNDEDPSYRVSESYYNNIQKSSRKFINKKEDDDADIEGINNNGNNMGYPEELTKTSGIPYNLLISKTTFIFSLVKIFKFENESDNFSPELVQAILKTLHYFIEDQPDNCLLVITEPILSSLAQINKNYIDLVMDLILTALKILTKYQYSLCNSHMIKNFAMKICYKSLGKENMYASLLRLLKILRMMHPIPTLYGKETLHAMRKDLKKLWQEYEVFRKYKDYLILLADRHTNTFDNDREKDFNRLEAFKEIFKEENISPQIAFKNYLKFLTLLNDAFDDNSLYDQSQFLSKILNSKEILMILKNKNLDLQLRTQMIRFFRMVYIDLCINKKKIKEYRIVFTKDYDKISVNDSLFSAEELKVFTFLEDLVKKSGLNMETADARDQYELLLFELQNIKEIIEKSKSTYDHTACTYYVENGLILPLKVYLNKIFSIVMNMSGKEFLKIYTLAYHILDMKRFILQSNIYNQTSKAKDEKVNMSVSKFDENKPPNENLLKVNFESVLKKTKMNLPELVEVEKDLEKITKSNFQALNYIEIYSIVSKHIMSLIQNPTSKELADYFSNNEEYHQEKLNDFYNRMKSKGIISGKSPYGNRLFELITQYSDQKKNYESSCIKTNMSENHLDHQLSFLHLLLRFLFFMSTQTQYLLKQEIYTKESNEIILKLLINDTATTQKAIQDLIQKDDKSVNLSYLAELGFNNLLSIIFSQYNPTSIELSDDYYLTCHIIKIFKFLCEEHNNFFQNIFLTKLEFKVDNFQKLYFYDMMIFVLDKILILTGWDKIKGTEGSEDVDYFYALFSCIVEMLVEVVQGTKRGNLTSLVKEDFYLPRMREETEETKKTNTTPRTGLQLTKTFKMKKKDPVFDLGKALPILLNNIKPLLFNDYALMETIYLARKELVDLLLAFMEEYSCPKRIKMLIMTTYYPQSIFKSIGNALKAFYIKHKKQDNPNEVIMLASTKTRLQINKGEEVKKRKTDIIVDRTLQDKKQGKKAKFYKTVKFSEDKYEYFTDLYFSDESFSTSPEFEFCAAFYNYFKLTVLQYEYKESVNFWEKIQNLSADELYDFNKRTSSNSNKVRPSDSKDKPMPMIDESDYETYYIIKFFEQISKSVKIKLENKKEPVLVVYTMSPLLKYLSHHSQEKFIRTVNRDNRYSKLYALMEETIYFKQEIEHNWKNVRKSALLKQAMKIDYYTIGVILYLVVVGINIILLATLRYAGQDSIWSESMTQIMDYISYAVLIFDAFFLIFWSFTKLPLHYVIETEKYFEKMAIEGRSREDLTKWDKFIIFTKAIMGKGEINTYIWLFIFVLVASVQRYLTFFFSIALMAVVNLSTTLTNIGLSIILKKGELIWTAILAFIVFYVWSTWGFFFIQDRYIETEGVDQPEYVCGSLLNCWLFATNNGIRFKAGIGKVLQDISFQYETVQFIFNSWFYDFSFFTIWDVILKHILFGIILDTFRELRKIQFDTDYDIANICFICEIKKDDCEKKNKNFEEHIEKEHNIWEYVNYMITLRLSEAQDLNAINSYAKENLEQKKINWLPLESNKNEERGEHSDEE